MIFKNDKVYNFLKWLALVFLDAFGIAYQGLAEIWNLPYGEQVCKTCVIISVFIGAIIGVSGKVYQEQKEGE